uniref:Putative reverse transcriptase domain-containing protein n=1 Tax=Tanacetum cinerariifolium TaxID=118510 RepID=A0A6L2P1M4_TANCI|nr:putative reverse transcriptase domain-containing protein [Tanacetum cinerariifolium]
MEEYYPDDEVQKLESEFLNHKMVGSDIDGYTTRFHELARLVPHLVTPESQRVNRYIQEKNYPLSSGVMIMMPSAKLQVEKDSDMARDLVMKIFTEANKPKSRTYHLEIDGQSEHTIQTLEDMLRSCAIEFGRNWDTHLSLVEFLDNNSYHSSLKCVPFEALYERKCQTPIAWAEVGESKIIRPEIIQETTKKIVQIKERLKAVRDRQKSFADNRQKPLEFSVCEKVILKVSPRKGVVCFGKRSKLSPRYVGSFEIVEPVGPIAYRLRLPQELVRVHHKFYVSN